MGVMQIKSQLLILWIMLVTASTKADLSDPCNFQCTFENDDFCGMKQDDTDDFDWNTKGHGSTESVETGPDKAYEGNFYMYIEASNPRKTGDKARIMLPPAEKNGPYDLNFMYSMYGHHIGHLTIKIYQKRGGVKVHWLQRGDHGKKWYTANTRMFLMEGDQVVLEGVRGTEYSGDIAVDDLWLRCIDKGLTKETRTTTISITTTKVITSLKKLDKKPIFECSFDTPVDVKVFCGMQQYVGNGTYQWSIYDKNGETEAPEGMDTNNNFMYIDTNNVEEGEKVRAILPDSKIIARHKYCLEFRYFLWGNPNDKILINLQYGMSGVAATFKTLQQQAKQWQYVRQQLFFKTYYMPVIVAVRGKGPSGIIAVDDIKLTPCNLY